MSDNSKHHDGHRERMRERYKSEGLDSFADHEVLELLLFYSVARVNTNDLAHELISHFGSLANVMDSTAEEMCTVKGIGENSALLMRLVSDINRRCSIERGKEYECFDTIGKVGNYLKNLYIGLPNERLYMMMFDNGMKLIDTCIIADGTVNSTAISYRKIAEEAIFHHAAGVILSHNHPRGIPVPSGADFESTHYIENALSYIGIRLIDHVIVGKNSFEPIMHGANYVRANDMFLDSTVYSMMSIPENFYSDL